MLNGQTTSYTYDNADRILTAGGINYAVNANGNLQPFGYTGHQRDPEDGLVYLRARMYDPGTGRFLSRDVFSGLTAAPSTLNRFTYALNNPAVLVDPSGLDPSNSVLQYGAPGRCAPPFLPAAIQMLIDETYCRPSTRSSKQDQQLDYRPEIHSR